MWSSNTIQECDNQISGNKSWLAVQLKSGSSCFWKGLFVNVIELYQQEFKDGNINNHKVIILPSQTISQWMLKALGGESGDRSLSFTPEPEQTTPSYQEKSQDSAQHWLWLHWETIPSKWKALLVVSNTDIHHGKVHRIQIALQEHAAGHINTTGKMAQTIMWSLERRLAYERRHRWFVICIWTRAGRSHLSVTVLIESKKPITNTKTPMRVRNAIHA